MAVKRLPVVLANPTKIKAPLTTKQLSKFDIYINLKQGENAWKGKFGPLVASLREFSVFWS